MKGDLALSARVATIMSLGGLSFSSGHLRSL